ncbi:MAG: sugar transferase [Paludibacteraceae bacterium]|nr:sugar transferase [Paludibacteraceae bacterium]
MAFTFYTPSIRTIVVDMLILLFNFLLITVWLKAVDTVTLQSYPLYIVFSLLWIASNYFLKRYRKQKNEKAYVSVSFHAIYATVIAATLNYGIFFAVGFPVSILNYSIFVLGVLLLQLVHTTLLFAYLYALDIEEVALIKVRPPANLVKEPYILEEETLHTIKQSIVHETNTKVLHFLLQVIDLQSSATKVLSSTSLFNFEKIRNYRYNVLVNLRRLNDIRGINVLFSKINEKLPDNGIYIGCFENSGVKKRDILKKYPKGINWVIYSFYYFVKRVIPKIFITRRLYYDITQGRNRVLTKTEVYGRLYYCGFEIIGEKKIGDQIFFVARRKQEPNPRKKRRYGPVIQLKRIGKNGRVFKFYKMRTMYPYSEFLQAYIYEHNKLQEGGKFSHDIRISTLGKFFRRFWIDELPMILNFLKGDMKLVGVRPISQHYFSLYSKELQEKRIKFKPGLLPPFYADMPKTLEEIESSEMRYLQMCEKKGVLITDIIYLWKIFVNIVFKRARSK